MCHMKMQIVLFRNWTRVAESTSYNNNRYAINANKLDTKIKTGKILRFNNLQLDSLFDFSMSKQV